jgi:anti-sigma B factor antagonist
MSSVRNLGRQASRISSYEIEPNIICVCLKGRLDVRSIPQIQDEFQRITISGGKPVIVDLSGVELMNSVGLAMLIDGANSLRAVRTPMILLNPGPRVEKMIRIAHVDQFLPIVHDVKEALRKIKTAA